VVAPVVCKKRRLEMRSVIAVPPKDADAPVARRSPYTRKFAQDGRILDRLFSSRDRY
jgi:hypothetical protein